MRYQCLVLDHDDTVVDSTASVHYPAFMETLRRLRPGKWESLTLEEYFLYNFEPGFAEFCRDILGFTAEEDAEQGRAWEHYVAGHVPKAYPGMKEFLWRCREAGIRLCVVSHSLKENILARLAGKRSAGAGVRVRLGQRARKAQAEPVAAEGDHAADGAFARRASDGGRPEAGQADGRRLRRGFRGGGLGAPCSADRGIHAPRMPEILPGASRSGSDCVRKRRISITAGVAVRRFVCGN